MKTAITIALMILLPSGIQFPNGKEIVDRVNSRDEGEVAEQLLHMELINSRGKIQKRSTVVYRKDYSDQRKSMLFYTSPPNVKGTGFLTFDYWNDQEDDQWLYLPALRKTRRISAANRGDYFLGTDLTYEDIKLATKIGADDYLFKTLGQEVVHGSACYLVEGIPKTEKIKKELGYSKVHYWIDKEIWISRKNFYWDIAGNELKTLEIKGLEKIEGIWTITEMEVTNHKTGHQSKLKFEDTTYSTQIDDVLFSEQTLVRGI